MSTYEDSTPYGYNFCFNKNQLVYDVIYSPRKTSFLSSAEAAGCKIRNGFGMLINQGISAFEIWTGRIVAKDISMALLNKIDKLEDL